MALVHRCARWVRCAVCAVCWATWPLCTVVPTPCVVLRVRCPGPLCSCPPVCWINGLCCVCGVLGHLAPVNRCARSVRCVVCAVSWATWLLFTGVHTRCDVLHVRCCGPLGSCSQMCQLCALYCVCSVLRPVLPFSGMRVRCSGPLGPCSLVSSLGALCCVCGVPGLLAPVHRCAGSLLCVACAVSWAIWLLFTAVPVRGVVLRVRCPWPLGSCSPVCALGALFFVCGVLGYLAPVHQCARSVRCVACAVSWGTWVLLTNVPARCVVLRVRCPRPLGSSSLVCPICALCCVCGFLGHSAPVHRCVSSVRCVACAVSLAPWFLFARVLARCVVLRVRCPGPPRSRSLVCSLSVLWGMCGARTGPSGSRLLCSRLGLGTLQARTCPSGRRLFRSRLELGSAHVHPDGGWLGVGLGRVGPAGLLGACWCGTPFLLPFCFTFGPLCVLCALAVFFSLFFLAPASRSFFLCFPPRQAPALALGAPLLPPFFFRAPLFSAIPWFPAMGALGLGALWLPAPSSSLFFFASPLFLGSRPSVPLASESPGWLPLASSPCGLACLVCTLR